MCGRYTLAGSLDEIAAYFEAKTGQRGEDGNPLWDWEPKYNIAPGTVVPVIAYDGRKDRKVVPMRWGLHPHWKKEPPEGRPMFNARVETASEKPSFRTPFKRRRALIPATGWYEWEGVEKPKTPYYIHEDDKQLFAFAGLWDQWRVDEGITLLSVTILTTSAIGQMKHLHHRMPVRLPKNQWNNWLDWDVNADAVLNTKKGSDDLDFYDVDTKVNSGRAMGADLIRPAE
ncbi:MAG: SOS response-associated peptidase [Hellea sp.]